MTAGDTARADTALPGTVTAAGAAPSGPAVAAGQPAVRYTRRTVAVDGGQMTVGVWGEAGPLVVAAHGITSSHLAWGIVGPDLGRDHRFVALDLRGRGRSRDLPAPYGMDRHAADVAAVIAAFGGGPAILVGHSMGGFVVVRTLRSHLELAARAVLVDGGAPLPLPPGIDPAGGEEEIARAVTTTVGAAYARLSLEFPSVQAYVDSWRAHPSLSDWNDAMTAYVEYDLVGEVPALRPACLLAAATRDARDVYALGGERPEPLPVPAVFLRAERGMFNGPDPLYPAGEATRWFPGIAERVVPDTNHYTITLGPDGAGVIAAAVRAG